MSEPQMSLIKPQLVKPQIPQKLFTVEIIHSLLRTLGNTLDIQEAFTSACADIYKVIRYDDAYLYLRGAVAEQGYWLNRHDDGSPPELGLLFDGSEANVALVNNARVGSDLFGSAAVLPLLSQEEIVGRVILVACSQSAYSERDLPLLQAVADCLSMVISHRRLAESSVKATTQREQTEHVYIYEELLRVISSVPDVCQVLPRISQIAAKVIPHDRLTLSFHDADRNIVMQAVSNDDGPRFDRLKAGPNVFPANGSSQIIPDMSTLPSAGTEPPDLPARIVKAGYYSIFLNHVSTREHGMSLAFWSKRKNAFSESDIPAAQRMAEQLAVAVSIEQFMESQKQTPPEVVGRVTAPRAKSEVANDHSYGEGHPYKFDTTLIVGDSPQWTNVLKAAMRVALTGMTVLLTGESGTGKEVVARFIHHVSARKAKPFVAVNCAAFPEQLLESEFFGYERGAFTGADVAKVGRIEQAENGVLFLDEISEMTSSAQAKFLRVLEVGEFQRLGGTRLLRASAQIMAATNKDLRKAVERDQFRQDLYYRLRVFEIRLPALRDRRSDIIPLAEGFLKQLNANGREIPALSVAAKNSLLAHEWRGNVRELKNTVERAALVCDGKFIYTEDLFLDADDEGLVPLTFQTTDLNLIERHVIDRVMRECSGNKSRAAKLLGLSRTQLYVRLRK